MNSLNQTLQPFLNTMPANGPHAETCKEYDEANHAFHAEVEGFEKSLIEQQATWKNQKTTNGELKKAVDRLSPLAETSRNLIKQVDLLYKLACHLIEICEDNYSARDSDVWSGRNIIRARKTTDEARQLSVEHLKRVRYFWREAHWLTERFPDAQLRDVEGLVKLVDIKEISANDWSLTPGRYVGVSPNEENDFDYEEALHNIHIELEDLNTEAIRLAATIKKNFEELGI
jgi:type I restriction enzyme M protein